MSGARLNADLWVYEYISPHDIYCHGVSEVLASKKTEFQDMHIVSSGLYGKALVLDGKWQSCTGEEFLYHEPLVHVACVNHGAPENVLVLGGGEGATVREALKWKSVKRVVMVDIDPIVVEACKEHLPEMHQGAFDDPRTELVVGDALVYLDESVGQWDVIISDLSDPIAEGPSYALFTKEYFEKCRRALKAGGYFVVQAGPVAPPRKDLHVGLVNTVKAVFPNVAHFITPIAAYGSPWGYVMGSAAPIEANPDPAAVDELLAAKTTGNFLMFDGLTLRGLMSPPKYLRDAVARETRVYTMDTPPQFEADAMGGSAKS
jgi:spermidine synthase